MHNLGRMDWGRRKGFDWAESVNEQVKQWIKAEDHRSVIDCEMLGGDFKQAIPTPDHFWPLLYVLGASKVGEAVEFFNDAIPFGAISMTGVKIG